jgi:hypothetical protein
MSTYSQVGGFEVAFPLDVPMVPSSALAVAADSECLSCGGFYLGNTIHFWSLEFITCRIGGMSLSPRRDGSDAVIMGSTHSGPLSPLRAMVGDSTKEFHIASDREGGGGLASALHEGMTQGLRPHCHNHIVVRELSDHSGYDDTSTTASDATARQQAPF